MCLSAESCLEETTSPAQFDSPDSKLVVPAPLPGYAFALLEPFARLEPIVGRELVPFQEPK